MRVKIKNDDAPLYYLKKCRPAVSGTKMTYNGLRSQLLKIIPTKESVHEIFLDFNQQED